MFEDEKSSDNRYTTCKSGGLLCHECKHDLIDPVKSYMVEFKRKREQAKNMVDKFVFED
jgi:tryptophanyl-tRNA synthetase